MNCKQHPCDLSGSVGVCASCLRQRLLALIAAQSKLHHHHQSTSSSDQLPRKSDSSQHPLVFPRSVSPYVARRKSHDHRGGGGGGDDDLDSCFHTTPQLGPTYSSSSTSSCQRKYAKLSLFANLFRSRSDKLRNPDLDTAAAADSAQPSGSSSSSWFSSILSGRRKKQSAVESLPLPPPRRRHRGMSPADRELPQECDPTPPGGDVWELKRTPTSVRRGKAKGGNNGGNSNATGAAAGFAFCLSPLVRASPNRHWNQKAGSLAPDLGEVRVAVKPNLSMAASYCANRSRKLADFGRAMNHTR
ncbi:unnamed protein product [Linum tenue]|uniref:Uncharacterized protein n=1 Tax=Linum tenue TaxID=586396 RepID=A0AAV0PBC9_9ROSI|nr:unnamed protein product [Linum tenue]